MPQYLLSDIVGKDLYAAKNLVGYYSFPTNTKAIVSIQKGDKIGRVLTAIPWGSSPIKYYYDLVIPGVKNKLFVEIKDGSFDLKALAAQGALNVDEKKKQSDTDKADENSHWYSDLGSGIKKTVITLGITAAVVWGAVEVFKSKNKSNG